jgi:hypothetical protein
MFQIFSSLFNTQPDRSADSNMPRERETKLTKAKRLREYHDDEDFERPETRRAIDKALDPAKNEYDHGKGGRISDRRIILGIVHYRVKQFDLPSS